MAQQARGLKRQLILGSVVIELTMTVLSIVPERRAVQIAAITLTLIAPVYRRKSCWPIWGRRLRNGYLDAESRSTPNDVDYSSEIEY